MAEESLLDPLRHFEDRAPIDRIEECGTGVDAIEAVSTEITRDQSQQPSCLVGAWKPGSPPRGDHEGLMPSSAISVSGSTGVQGFVFCTPKVQTNA